MRHLLLVGLATLAVFGCASADDAGLDFRSSVEALQAENTRHGSACAASSSTSDIAAEMIQHEEAMASHVSRMDSAFTHVEHCYQGSASRFQQMMSTVRSCDERHSTRMEDATTLDAQQAECRSYTEITGHLLHEMHNLMAMNGGHCMMM